MQKYKINNLEEITIHRNKLGDEIKRDFKIQTAIITILAIIVCFKSMKLAIDYESLKKEKESLEELTEMQRSMISDLEENCKNLYIEKENLKEKYVY